jgi:hypothetical protein
MSLFQQATELHPHKVPVLKEPEKSQKKAGMDLRKSRHGDLNPGHG